MTPLAAWLAAAILAGPPAADDGELAISSPPGPAQPAAKTRDPARRRGYRPALDATATLLTGSFALVVGAARAKVAPATCRWCEPGPADTHVRDALVWQRPRDAAALSDVAAFWWIPGVSLSLHTVGLGRAGRLRGSSEDYLVIGEAVAITAGFTSAIKLASARQRPDVHFGAESSRLTHPSEQNLGFVSGHTSLAFATAVSTATVATLRRHALAPWIWGTAVPLAGLVGYLRVAADRHYLSDVLAGAGLGTVIGVAVPLIVHSAGPRWARQKVRVQITPAARGLVVSGRF